MITRKLTLERVSMPEIITVLKRMAKVSFGLIKRSVTAIALA